MKSDGDQRMPAARNDVAETELVASPNARLDAAVDGAGAGSGAPAEEAAGGVGLTI